MARHTSVLQLAFLAWLLCASAASPTGGQQAMLGGVNFVAEGFEGPFPYDDPASLASLATARSIGVSVVVFSFPWYIDNINYTAPPYRIDGGCPTGAPLGNASSPTDAAVITALRAAQALGMRVVLRPLVDPRWDNPVNAHVSRTDIGRYFSSDAQWGAWFESYTAFVLHWAAIAAAEGVTTFCVGAELSSTEAQEARWRTTIAAVRAVFNGSVYYSATGIGLSWWNASDFIAVDAYPALTNATVDPARVSVAQLVGAWNSTVEQLRAHSQLFGRPVLLAETGVCSIDAAGLYSHPYFYQCYTYAVNDAVQANYYEAVLQALWTQPFMAGIFFWKWAAQGGPSDTTFFPLNKTAQGVMAKYFGGGARVPSL